MFLANSSKVSGSTCLGVPVKYVLGNKISGYWIEGYLEVSSGPEINHTKVFNRERIVK